MAKRYDMVAAEVGGGLAVPVIKETPDGGLVVYADYARLLEAVRWMFECDDCGEHLNLAWHEDNRIDLDEIQGIFSCAIDRVRRIAGVKS